MKDTLINNFLRISKIPRQSGHEEKIAAFFVDIAKENNLYYLQDKNNNVLIKKKGNITSSPIALQAHLDMVCAKTPDSNHNFETDGIEVIIEDDIVTAKDTTLGADQGVGLAIMLTILEDNTLNHPDLEFLFTTEEETTFNGVVTFPYHELKSKRLINLDTAKDDVVVNGSDGDILNEYLFKGKQTKNNLPGYKITINNFPGGNSGDNIELSTKNAITSMAMVLKNQDILLKSINGGTFENDIASSCEVIINTSLDVEAIFQGLNPQIEKVNNDYSFSKEDTHNIINEILDLRCGYISNTASGNLGIIKSQDDEVEIYYIIRSIDKNELEEISNKSKVLNNHFTVHEIYRDSVWEINKYSKLLTKYKELYFKKYKEYPKEEIGHGGTECSAINKRIDGLDIISIGANMKDIHTIKETTYISSWIKMYELLIELLSTL